MREEQRYEGRKHVFWSLGFYCQFGDPRLQELVLREWATHTQDERHWQFQEVPIFMKMTIKALLLTNRLRETYESLKSFTSYLLTVAKTNLQLNHPYTMLINLTSADRLHTLAQEVLMKESIFSLRSNGYLSGLIFMVFLKI